MTIKICFLYVTSVLIGIATASSEHAGEGCHISTTTTTETTVSPSYQLCLVRRCTYVRRHGFLGRMTYTRLCKTVYTTCASGEQCCDSTRGCCRRDVMKTYVMAAGMVTSLVFAVCAVAFGVYYWKRRKRRRQQLAGRVVVATAGVIQQYPPYPQGAFLPAAQQPPPPPGMFPAPPTGPPFYPPQYPPPPPPPHGYSVDPPPPPGTRGYAAPPSYDDVVLRSPPPLVQGQGGVQPPVSGKIQRPPGNPPPPGWRM